MCCASPLAECLNAGVNVKKLIARFFRDERGVTATEYALMIALVAVVIIVGATALGTNLNDVFSSVAVKI